MAFIFEGVEKKEERKAKLFIYMKKEIEVSSEEELEKLKEIIKTARDLDLFDEIFITEKEDLEEILAFKKYYEAIALKEIKMFREEMLKITKIIKGILERLNSLESKIQK